MYGSLDVSVKSVCVATHLSAVKRLYHVQKFTVALTLVWDRYLLQHTSVCKCRSSLSTVQVSVISFLCTSVCLLFHACKCPSSLSCVQVSVFSFLCTSVCSLLCVSVFSFLCTNVRLLFLMYKCLSSFLCVSVFSFLCTNVRIRFPMYKCLSSLLCVFVFSFLCTNVRLLFPMYKCLSSSLLRVHVSVFSHLRTISHHLFPVYKCLVFRPDSTCRVDWAFNYLHMFSCTAVSVVKAFAITCERRRRNEALWNNVRGRLYFNKLSKENVSSWQTGGGVVKRRGRGGGGWSRALQNVY